MPIIIKVTKWQQTSTNITIKIPSYGIPSDKIDIFTSNRYIKAHYSQYFFEIFLYKFIDVKKSNCTVTDTDIIFELTKFVEEDWEQLEEDLNKADKKKIRQEIIEEAQKQSQEDEKNKRTRNSELKRVAVREQMKLDTKKHQYIDEVIKSDKENALKEIKLFEQNHKEQEVVIKDVKTEFKKTNDPTKYKTSKKIKPPLPIPQEPKTEPAIPLPRKYQTINIKFTDREFPTPQRESRIQEEEEWLAKQAAARRSAGFNSKDLRPEERNPQWLKAKGDEFLNAKNYYGAISAYSEGIKISKEFVDLYISRSAAHFALGNWNRTITDCSTALDIMKPPVPANLEMRAKCIARRGAALYKINMEKEGIKEFEEALKLIPNNKELREEIEKIKIEVLKDTEE